MFSCLHFRSWNTHILSLKKFNRIVEHAISLFPPNSQPILLFCETGPSPPRPTTTTAPALSLARRPSRAWVGELASLCMSPTPALLPVVTLERETPHCLWLRVTGGAGGGGDLFVGAVYIPPEPSPHWEGDNERRRDAFTALRDDILSFQPHGRVLLLGDFNAHAGSLADTIPPELEAPTPGPAHRLSARRAPRNRPRRRRVHRVPCPLLPPPRRVARGTWSLQPPHAPTLPPHRPLPKLEHSKALMCVRCVAYPLRACPTSFPRSDLSLLLARTRLYV